VKNVKHRFIRYLFGRLATLLLSLTGASIALFVLLRLIPGDPSSALLPIGATQDQIDAARHAFGTDVSIWQQLLRWIGNLVNFDFGDSLISQSPVLPEILSRLRITVPLTLTAFLLAILIAMPIGFLAAYKSRTWYGTLVNNLSQVGIAVPIFWVGVVLIYIFALRFMFLPAGGFPPQGWEAPADAFKSLILPTITIALVMSASLIRYVRSATLDVLNSDFIRTSRSLGFSVSQSMLKHGLRNGAGPLVSVLGIELATTFVGAVVVESVFALPGLGSLLVKAISEHDYPTVQGILFLSTLTVMLIGFIADLFQSWLDPRLGTTRGGDEK
jgi:peptide/nickel transport system permease protein